MNLQELRQKYPQYNDMSDEEFADKFYRKFYSDMPREDFNNKIGFTPSSEQGVKQDIQQQYGNKTWGQVFREVPGNILPSAGEFAKNVVQPIIHPIDTATNLYSIGKGAIQLLNERDKELNKRAGGFVPMGTDAEKYARAFGKFLIERYGSIPAIKHTIATDPVGVAGDLSAILGVGGKVSGVATVSKALNMASRSIDPLVGVGKVASGVGKVAAEIPGLATGVGSDAFRISAKAGAEGGDALAALRAGRRGLDQDAIVNELRGAVRGLREARGQDYVRKMAALGAAHQTPLNFNDVDQAVANTVATFKGQSISTKTAGVQQEIAAIVDKWKTRAPADFHTPEGFDAMKKEIWNDVMGRLDPRSPDYKAAKTVYDAVKSTIEKQAPEYAKIMKGYEEAETHIREIERELTGNPKAPIGPAIRKITSALRNNVNTNFGKRRELLEYLEKNGAPHLLARIAGSSTKEIAPRSLARVPATMAVEGLAGAGGLSTLLHSPESAIAGAAAAIPGMALASPALMGRASALAGHIGAGRIPFTTRRIPPRVGLGASRLFGQYIDQ